MSSIVCGCKSCSHNDPIMRTCTLKVVFIDKDGTCGDREDNGTEEDVSGESNASETE